MLNYTTMKEPVTTKVLEICQGIIWVDPSIRIDYNFQFSSKTGESMYTTQAAHIPEYSIMDVVLNRISVSCYTLTFIDRGEYISVGIEINGTLKTFCIFDFDLEDLAHSQEFKEIAKALNDYNPFI